MTTTPDATLEQLVLADPGLAAVFDRLGLDFCCHGERTLAQACATAGVPVAEAAAAIEAAAGTADAAAADWTGYGPAEPARHIQAAHHAYLTAEHEAAGELLGRLAAATGGYRTPADGCASYALLYRRLAHLGADTHLHVLEENSVLFPAARALEAERQAAPAS